jgi:hypothetical protein
MGDSIVNHARWEWMKDGMTTAGMEGFWLATKMGRFDPRDDIERSAWGQKLRMDPPKEATYTIEQDGRTIEVTDKYWEDKLEQKKKIRKLKKEFEEKSSQDETETITLILGVARRVFMGTRKMERRKRWEETAEIIQKKQAKLKKQTPQREGHEKPRKGRTPATILTLDPRGRVISATEEDLEAKDKERTERKQQKADARKKRIIKKKEQLRREREDRLKQKKRGIDENNNTSAAVKKRKP